MVVNSSTTVAKHNNSKKEKNDTNQCVRDIKYLRNDYHFLSRGLFVENISVAVGLSCVGQMNIWFDPPPPPPPDLLIQEKYTLQSPPRFKFR